jgi:lipoprotein Spr
VPAFAQFFQPEWQLEASSEIQHSSFQHIVIKEKLLAQYQKWKGVKYKWGGTNHRGIDCSALTQKFYARVLKKYLPRTTGGQVQMGHYVEITTLKPGDLVFFQTKKSVRHVGIYVGSGQFIHASSSKGVTLSSLQNNFWRSHIETARRIIG